MKISILLPYKENYSKEYAGAVSIFVNGVNKYSKFIENINIYGNTDYSNILSKNYVNLPFKKNMFQSSSKTYVNNFIKNEKKIKSNIIEIHNRPNYLKYFKNEITSKVVFYFHNDPLSMNGSKTIANRMFILQLCKKVIFNSEWTKNRFFIGIDKFYLNSEKIDVIYQSTVRTSVDLDNKKKTIMFVGKLNKSKGYDLFGKAIIQILNKHKEWKGVVFGDEPREDLFFDHSRLKIMGFKDNNFILNYLKKVSISVVCSRWNEPFGRSSLEASSRGSAVIISNKGGLPETCKSAIKLKVLSVKCIFNEIDKLIQNKKNLLKIQKKNYTNFKYTHSYISKIIDSIRGSVLK